MTNRKSIGCLLAAAGLIAAAGCKREQPLAPATVEKVKEDPKKYYGREVTLTGEVDQVFGARGFELESNELFDEQVLVVARSEIRLGNSTVADDQKVRVTGTVRALVVAEVERETGWDLEPEVEAEFSSRPVIVARSVTRVDEPQLAWNETATAPAQQASPPLTELAAIVDAKNPVEMADRSVELERVAIHEVAGDRVFWIGPRPDQRLLVVLSKEPFTSETPVEGRVVLEKGRVVTLSGILRKAPVTAAERQRLALAKHPQTILDKQAVYLEARKVDLAETTPAAGRRRPR